MLGSVTHMEIATAHTTTWNAVVTATTHIATSTGARAALRLQSPCIDRRVKRRTMSKLHRSTAMQLTMPLHTRLTRQYQQGKMWQRAHTQHTTTTRHTTTAPRMLHTHTHQTALPPTVVMRHRQPGTQGPAITTPRCTGDTRAMAVVQRRLLLRGTIAAPTQPRQAQQ